MKKIIVPAVCFAAWMALLMYDIPVNGNFLPALGRFTSPFCGFWQNTKPQKPTFTYQGNTIGDVSILMDERAIPHIYAAHTADALYAQGYLHAANRLFAMDITTRAAAGRLSELLGARTLPYDRKQRERGYERSAIAKAKSWESHAENQAYINAYVAGVNAYVQSLSYRDWPIEYKILSHAPVEWTSTHCALVMTSMAISLCLGEDDVEYSQAHALLSAEDFAFLYPDHNPNESPIIPPEKKWDFEVANIPQSIGQANPPHFNASHEDEYLNGSNNWAVAPGKTKNGFAIVANDPHLNLTLPNIWYEVEMHTPDMHVHGVTLPGLPFVILGFNDHIAWGSTNSGQDVLDWYQIHWQDSSRHAYQLDGQYMQAELRPEVIAVRGGTPVTDTIRYTHWGPVTHLDEHTDMAMKWIGHQKATSNDVDYLKKINSAKDIYDYREAVASFQYPAQNKVFGSVHGDIAISVAGVMPIRPAGNGETVTEGNASVNDWQGYIPFEQAPFIINPSIGYVSSANQIPVDTTYPYPMIGKRVFEDYRGRTVNLVLDTARQITPASMQQMQQNDYSLYAAEFLPILLQALAESNCIETNRKKYIELLTGWNYSFHRDSLSPVLFDIWTQQFNQLTWDELDTAGLMWPETWRIVDIAAHAQENHFFDILSTTTKKETMQDIACLSFSMMIDSFENISSDRRANWGQYKHSSVNHLARFPGFGVEYLATSGGKYIINAMTATHGPSWRMVAEMSTPPKAWVNYPGGQSGDPASPHYKDFLEHYFDGQYYEVMLRPDPTAWKPVYQFEIKSR